MENNTEIRDTSKMNSCHSEASVLEINDVSVMSKEQLCEYITRIHVDLNAEKEKNDTLADQLTVVSVTKEEIDTQLQEAISLLESERCSAAEKVTAYEEEVLQHDEKIKDLNEEMIFNQERSKKNIEDMEMQLEASKANGVKLSDTLMSMEKELQRKEELIDNFEQEVSKLKNMEDELINVLDTKRSIFKRIGRKRKSRALEMMNGTRAVLEKIRSLFH